MRRLTIHLKDVGHHSGLFPIKNTLSFIVKNDKEIESHLSTHGWNVQKHYLTNL
jgi:hypothetical protein